MSTTRLNSTMRLNGFEYPKIVDITGSGITVRDPSVPAAKTGQLTTRTNDTDGVITMDSGHGMTTSDIIAVFWSDGSGGYDRRYRVDTAVSTDEVTISNGAGDDLPVVNTNVIAMEMVTEDFAITGDNLDALAAYCQATAGVAVFLNSTTIHAVADFGLNNAYQWDSNGGVTNPVAGDTLTDVSVAHMNTSSAITIRVGAHYNDT